MPEDTTEPEYLDEDVEVAARMKERERGRGREIGTFRDIKARRGYNCR